jgi:hypothetical protein
MAKLIWRHQIVISLLLILLIMTGGTMGDVALSTVLTEEEINAELAESPPDDFDNLAVDLVPGGMNIQMTTIQGRRPIDIVAATTVVVEDNAIAVSVTEISAERRSLPPPVVARVNAEVIPAVTQSINEQIPVGEIQSVTTTNTEMTVTIGNFIGAN